MVLGTAVDLSVLSYPMLVITKEQGADVERGEVWPQTSDEAESSPRGSSEAEPTLRGRGRRGQPLVI